MSYFDFLNDASLNWQTDDREPITDDVCPVCGGDLEIVYYTVYTRDGDFYDAVSAEQCTRAKCEHKQFLEPAE